MFALALCVGLGSGCVSPRTDEGSSATAAGRVERGRYLANGIARCFSCHSPLDNSDPAVPRPETLGAGDVLDEKAPIVAPNITPDTETGLGNWSDQGIIRATREGIGRDARELYGHPTNYYSVMTDEDATAVVAYLRSMRPIRRQLARSVPPARRGEHVQRRGVPAQASALKSPTQRGAYLVQLGECIGCHTTTRADGTPFLELAFGGGRRFRLEKGYGVELDVGSSSAAAAVSPTDRVVASMNITQDPSGIAHYTEATFIQTIRTGKVAGIRPLSGAMPWIFFRTMTDADLKDVFAFLQSVRPVQHRVNNSDPPTWCPRCGRRHGLGEFKQP
jgi:mono/diheme cytochrome c family protein